MSLSSWFSWHFDDVEDLELINTTWLPLIDLLCHCFFCGLNTWLVSLFCYPRPNFGFPSLVQTCKMFHQPSVFELHQ